MSVPNTKTPALLGPGSSAPSDVHQGWPFPQRVWGPRQSTSPRPLRGLKGVLCPLQSQPQEMWAFLQVCSSLWHGQIARAMRCALQT